MMIAVDRSSLLASMLYRSSWLVGRFVFFCTMNTRVHHREVPRRHPGPFVLAVTHLANMEPFIVGDIVRRRIDWMARKEFFRFAPFRWFLKGIEAFEVNRQGVAVAALPGLGGGASAGLLPPSPSWGAAPAPSANPEGQVRPLPAASSLDNWLIDRLFGRR